MKLAIENFDLRQRYGDRRALELLADAGFEAVDYSFYWMRDWDAVFTADWRAYAERLRDYAMRLGLCFTQAHAPFDVKYNMDRENYTREYRRVLDSMEFAALLGVDTIVVHAQTVAEREKFFDYNLAYYNSLKPYCEKFGIRVGVENLFMPDVKRGHAVSNGTASPTEFCAMLDALGDPCMVGCVDTGHATITGWEPEELIRAAGSRVACLHLQDTDYQGDRHMVPFMGDINWREVMSALGEVHYSGDLTLEVFKYIRRQEAAFLPKALRLCRDTADYLRQMLREEQGNA